MKRITPPPSQIIQLELPEDALAAPPPPDVEVSCIKSRYVTKEGSIDPDAIKVVRRLNRFGYEAYLVGGSIRDILFGLQPKDFDIATSALPSEVRRLFGNCRLIGRRFRLAHLFFKHGKIIEVATFRRGATEEDDIQGRHAHENLFGGPADDAIRRDFTINALMYDVARRVIYDWVGGLSDIESRILRTIGDPDRRFKEDPVRIIRAVKFSVRLDLRLSQIMIASMTRNATCLNECAPARLVEEILKLLRGGNAARCFDSLQNTSVLEVLLPTLASEVEKQRPEEKWRYLQRADEAVNKGNQLSDATLICALIYPFVHDVFENKGDIAPLLEEKLANVLDPMKFTKRHLAKMRQLLLAQRRLAKQPLKRKARQLLDREYAADALDFKELTCESIEDRRILTAWLEAFAMRRVHRKRVYGNRNRKRKPRKPRMKTNTKC